MGTDLGRINEMRFADGKWKVEETLELPSKSNVILPYKDRMLIVTTKTILFFDGTNNFDFIKKDGWHKGIKKDALLSHHILRCKRVHNLKHNPG